MKKLYEVFCLDTCDSLWFLASTPYEAMRMALYYLNITNKDKSAVINQTESGKTLWFEYKGKTYSILNN